MVPLAAFRSGRTTGGVGETTDLSGALRSRLSTTKPRSVSSELWAALSESAVDVVLATGAGEQTARSLLSRLLAFAAAHRRAVLRPLDIENLRNFALTDGQVPISRFQVRGRDHPPVQRAFAP